MAGNDHLNEYGAEDDEERKRDRQMIELLNELRVALPGVQILFAFLLVLPFSNGFEQVTAVQRDVYVVALLAAAAAAGAIISPVAFHRALFRQGRKPELVRYAHRMARIGLAFLLIAMVSSVFLVVDYLLSRPVAIVLAAVTAAWFVAFWLAFPWYRHNWIDEAAEAEDVRVSDGDPTPSDPAA